MTTWHITTDNSAFHEETWHQSVPTSLINTWTPSLPWHSQSPDSALKPQHNNSYFLTYSILYVSIKFRSLSATPFLLKSKFLCPPCSLMYLKLQEQRVPSMQYRFLRTKEWGNGWSPLVLLSHRMALFPGHFHKSCRKFSGNVSLYLPQFSSKWPLTATFSVLAIRGALSTSPFIWKEARLSGVHFQITCRPSLWQGTCNWSAGTMTPKRHSLLSRASSSLLVAGRWLLPSLTWNLPGTWHYQLPLSPGFKFFNSFSGGACRRKHTLLSPMGVGDSGNDTKLQQMSPKVYHLASSVSTHIFKVPLKMFRHDLLHVLYIWDILILKNWALFIWNSNSTGACSILLGKRIYSWHRPCVEIKTT